MIIGIASDHRGYDLKEKIKETLKNKYQIEDFGTDSNISTDYPDYAFKLGEAIRDKKINFGIAICGTGIGISIACNKVKKVRCAKVDNIDDVYKTRIDNDSNIIAFSSSTSIEKAIEYVEKFINTPCSNEEKHVRRRNKIKEYEDKNDR